MNFNQFCFTNKKVFALSSVFYFLLVPNEMLVKYKKIVASFFHQKISVIYFERATRKTPVIVIIKANPRIRKFLAPLISPNIAIPQSIEMKPGTVQMIGKVIAVDNISLATKKAVVAIAQRIPANKEGNIKVLQT